MRDFSEESETEDGDSRSEIRVDDSSEAAEAEASSLLENFEPKRKAVRATAAQMR